ncbi:hypothetical protein [Microcoleus sp. Pol10D4]|uniref:hypothetical protein n=1 Tax=Microcoleus sp. Pol10D4 TaxID=3055387 RepID=UPI002FD03E8C
MVAKKLVDRFMADKPKGGRGKKAPYNTKQMRVPQPLWTQVETLCDRYQEFIAAGGDPANPPFFLERAIVAPAAEQRYAQTTDSQLSTERTSKPSAEAKLSKHQQLWEELNPRQQTYLRLIFETDQQREASERGGDWRRSGTRPASQWRWIEYAEIFGVSTPFRMRIKEAGEVDPGTGSTFKALATRKLIEIRYPYDDLRWLDCKLTLQGRAVARAGLGLEAPKKAPKGQLKERQWAALVAAYVAGDGGVKKDENLNYGGFSWEWTWLRLRDYSGGGLIKERSGFVGGRYEHDLAITQFGRHFYRSNWQKYRELYPNVDALTPV